MSNHNGCRKAYARENVDSQYIINWWPGFIANFNPL